MQGTVSTSESNELRNVGMACSAHHVVRICLLTVLELQVEHEKPVQALQKIIVHWDVQHIAEAPA